MAETSTLGGWTAIGYTAPGATKGGVSAATSNFCYANETVSNCTTNTVQGSDDESKASWAATSNAALNDCAVHSTWSLGASITESGVNNAVTYKASITGGEGKECASLTPSFKKLATEGKLESGS